MVQLLTELAPMVGVSAMARSIRIQYPGEIGAGDIS